MDIITYKKQNEKENPLVVYSNIRFYVDEKMNPWVKKYKKAFKLLDEDNEYNCVILLKAYGGSSVSDKNELSVKNIKKCLIIDK